MKVAPDRLRKGQLKMRSLVTSIRDVYDASASVRGRLYPGSRERVRKMHAMFGPMRVTAAGGERRRSHAPSLQAPRTML